MTFEQMTGAGRLENERQILEAIELSLDSPEGKSPSMIDELKREHRRTIMSIVALDNAANRTQAA